MENEEIKLPNLETKDAVISPIYLTASLIILIFSLGFQLFNSVYRLFYYNIPVMIIYIALYLLGIVLLLIAQIKIAQVEALNKKQTIKIILSTVFYILSLTFLLANLPYGLYRIAYYYRNIIAYTDNSYLVIPLVLFLSQGIFQLIGHILYRSAIRDISGKTKLDKGLVINICVLAGLILGQIIGILLSINNERIIEAIFVFYSFGIAIPIASTVFYGLEIRTLQKLIAQPIPAKPKMERNLDIDNQVGISKTVRKFLEVAAILFAVRYLINFVVNIAATAYPDKFSDTFDMGIWWSLLQTAYLLFVLIVMVVALKRLYNEIQCHEGKIIAITLLLVAVIPLKILFAYFGHLLYLWYPGFIHFSIKRIIELIILSFGVNLAEIITMIIILSLLGAIFFEMKEKNKATKLIPIGAITIGVSLIGQLSWMLISYFLEISHWIDAIYGITILYGIGGVLGFLGMYLTVRQPKELINKH
ncbi:MAG: hypothetical protein ACTSXA_12960 [Candidatus Heimdallarchaeota archaeon]